MVVFWHRDDGGAPRVCGDDPIPQGKYSTQRWVLPAYAGMIPAKPSGEDFRRCAPRVCGDDPIATDEQAAYLFVLPAYAGMIL